MINLLSLGLIVMICFSAGGCKPVKQKNITRELEFDVSSSPSKRTSNNQDFDQAALPFNQDVHVIRSLWNELNKESELSDDQSERKQLLTEALQKRIAALNSSESRVEENNQELLDQIREYLQE